MISDIPTKQDFEEQGLTLLNLAWDTVAELLLDFQYAEEWGAIVEDEQVEEYNKASQKPLAISTALLQQGAELLVKSVIAEVSPYLLITDTPNAWPRKCDKQNIPFSAFKTADASDLIRIHDTVAKKRFSDEFVQTFKEMRKIRNTVFHSVDRKLRFSEKQIIKSILTITTEILVPLNWMEYRDEYLETVPSAAWNYEGNGYQLAREFSFVIDLLGNADLKHYFGFNKKQRRYICPGCIYSCREVNSEFIPLTAQLNPNSPKSTKVSCVVCRQEFPVKRASCSDPECKGNVINMEKYSDNECLTCFTENLE